MYPAFSTAVRAESKTPYSDTDGSSRALIIDEKVSSINTPYVVYVGETHDQPGYHQNQLAVVEALVRHGFSVAIGLEMIQSPFQQYLNQFVEGTLNFNGMLEKTEYFDRWRYDPRLYRNIFLFARQNHLPLIALNAPRELTDRISEVGINGLKQEERLMLPENLAPLIPEYRQLLEAVYEEHAEMLQSDLDHFIEVQQAWDESMAQAGGEFLRANPDHILVVLAGTQHVANGYGIPHRIEHHFGFKGSVVLGEQDGSESADVLLPVSNTPLTPSGKMGVLIDDSKTGVRISGFVDDSPAGEVGMLTGDIIVQINQRTITGFSDVKLALWHKKPGDSVEVTIRRQNEQSQQSLEFSVSLF